MAQDTPVNGAGTTSDLYCTPDDVAIIRGEAPYGEHESRSRRTYTQVEKLIRWEMATIDRRTGQSWRARRSGVEYHPITDASDAYGFIRIKLKSRNVLDLSSASGDTLEIRNSGAWEDFIAGRTQGPNGSYWIQGEDGWLHLRQVLLVPRVDAVRINYRSGATSLPEDITKATALLVAAAMEETTIRAHPDAGGGFAVENRARAWRTEAAQILSNYVVVGGLQ